MGFANGLELGEIQGIQCIGGQDRSFAFRPDAERKEAGMITDTEYSIQLTDFPSFTTSNLVGLRYSTPVGIVGSAARYRPAPSGSWLMASSLTNLVACS